MKTARASMRLPLLALVAAASFGAIAAAVLGPASGLGQRSQLLTDGERKWWETAVIYQIYPRSFRDSDGDGVGDLAGITEKLDYLKDLGVGAVWLSPIYPSPQADFGYDISDFTGIDKTYGNMDDFLKLLDKAHSLGLKVVLDFVPNHSSDEHEWFKKSVQRIDPYTNYYIWHDGKKSDDGTNVPPNNWISMFRGPAWKWNDDRQQWYMHQFLDKQPDLNYRDSHLVQEMKDAMKFWLDKGVDGFRVDAVWTLFEDEQLRDEPRNEGATDPEDRGYLTHIYTENQPGTYDMVTQWRALLDSYQGDRIMMTEAYSTLDATVAYYGTPEKPGSSFPFNFNLITSLGRSSKASDFKNIIDAWMSKMDSFRKPNWVMGNHDQNRVGSFARYGPELVDGISMISLMLPGTAMTYNGEEIGMEDAFITWEQTKDPQAINAGEENYLSKSRDLERTPFQWDSSVSAGFSSAKKTWLPTNPNYWRLNLKAEESAGRSHLKVYKALMKARQQPAVQGQSYSCAVVGDVLVITRALSGHDTFVVAVNLGSELAELTLSDLGQSSSLQVWTSSLNSDLQTGDSVTSSVALRPKEGLVLTTGAVQSNSGAVIRVTAAMSLVPTLVALLLRWTY